MSFEAAIGRIDQILQLQQQVQDPAGATSSASSGGAGLSTAAETSTPSTSFADMLSGAQEASDASAVSDMDSADTSGDGLAAGADPLAELTSLDSLIRSGLSPSSTAGGLAGLTGGAPTGAAGQSVQAMVDEANSLVGKPYVWGGGHGGWGPQAGYDCSGFVSAVLHAGGYLSEPEDTATLPTAPGIEAGPGQNVTIYDRDAAGQQGHVIIDIEGQFYESGGEAGAWGGGGGVEKIATPSAAYLATFNDVLHPEGL